MSDLISRQAAIEALRNRWLKTINFDGIGEDIAEECEICLRTVPSAQPEIIRCKDCKHIRHCGPSKAMCQDGKIHELDWYCADGERREQCD